MSNVASTLLPFFWQQCCRFRQQCRRFRQKCRTKFRSFDKIETNWTCSVCFDFVERTKFYNRIVRHCCRLWQQSRMLLRQSRMLPVASTLLLVWTGPNVDTDRSGYRLTQVDQYNCHKTVLLLLSSLLLFIIDSTVIVTIVIMSASHTHGGPYITAEGACKIAYCKWYKQVRW